MIEIKLPVEQWNIVMSALGNMPFAQVADLIAEVKKQASSQLEPVDVPSTEE